MTGDFGAVWKPGLWVYVNSCSSDGVCSAITEACRGGAW